VCAGTDSVPKRGGRGRYVAAMSARREFAIREARKEELEGLGQLMVEVYSGLEGFPGVDEQPRYYEMLANIGRLAEQPATKLLVAVAEDEVIGGVVYFSDMARYGAGGTASRESNASGFRLLAVDPDARGMGVGKALARRCIELAEERGHAQVIIHTTVAMKIAWGMYEQLGFARSPDLDFMQEALQVFGFRLALSRSGDIRLG
jgi:GNAT superfamily N-acetyltransferase